MSRRQIAAAIVAYGPDLNLLVRNVSGIASQVSNVFLWDNSEGASQIDRTALPRNVILIENCVNDGIAKPLNHMALMAMEYGCNWMLSLDQDSLVSKNYVFGLEQYLDRSGDERLVSVGGRLREPDNEAAAADPQNIATLITSGNLVKLSAWQAVGGYAEDLFVDGVDHDFCLKLRQHGFKVAQAQNVFLEHTIGTPYRVKILGLNKFVRCSNHSPLRRYYSSRNRWKLYRRYFRLDPRFVWLDFCAMMAEAAKVMLFEDQRLSKFKAMASGSVDAFLGRSGKCEREF